jgi:hypothetical protein
MRVSSRGSNSVKSCALSSQVNKRQKATYLSFLPGQLRGHLLLLMLICQEEVVKPISSPFRYPQSPDHDSEARVQGPLEKQRSHMSVCCSSCCCCCFSSFPVDAGDHRHWYDIVVCGNSRSGRRAAQHSTAQGKRSRPPEVPNSGGYFTSSRH